jgi:hypothetical protein
MHRKISSLIAALTIVLLTVTTTSSLLQIYPTKVNGNPITITAITNSASMSPMTLTLSTLPQTVTYWVNVTSGGSSTDYINNVCIKLPAGWANAPGASVQAGYGFGVSVAASGWANFTTGLTTFWGGAIDNFSIPVTISTIPTVGTWQVYCYQGLTPSVANPITITVTVNLQFSSTMSPNYVMNGTSYLYTLTTTNDACSVGIKEVDISFPAGQWSFNVLIDYYPRTWTVSYDGISTFTLTGPNILIGEYVWIKVNMTVPENSPTGEYYWTSSAVNAQDQYLGQYSIKAVVDASKPAISVVAPVAPYYSVGSGNYMWINATVTDTPSIETYGISVGINDTRFQPYAAQPRTETSPTVYVYYFVNTTAILDGHLAVLITATDPAGNIGTGTGQTTVDNTIPELIDIIVTDQNGNYLHVDNSGTYWMTATTTRVAVWADFYNPSGFTGQIYFNTTSYTFANMVWLPGYGVLGYLVGGSNLVVLNITLTDGSLPNANRYTNVWNIKRDIVPPSAPSYTKTTTICGGFIIWGLTATDNVGINTYDVYLNGSLYYLYPSDLSSDTLDWSNPFATIANITVVNLEWWGYMPGDVANITLNVMDYGSNVGPSVTFLVTVQAGQWYPMELYPKWNLISLPLIPNSTATANIYSLLLTNGASGVNFAYGFDNVGKTYSLNPTTMSDGKAYWVNMKAYDVLIVQGFPVYAPPGSPPPIVQYDLKMGWNLGGFTETDSWYAPDYVASLQSTLVLQSYFRFAYLWDADSQQWFTVDLTGNYYPYYLYPGQGFWIYLYNDQTLIPPI